MGRPKASRTFVCEKCGGVFPKTGHNQQMCEECRKKKKKEEKKISTYKGKPTAAPTVFGKKTEYDIAALAGKSLSTVAAEAAERGLTYGQYTVATRAGKLPPIKHKK